MLIKGIGGVGRVAWRRWPPGLSGFKLGCTGLGLGLWGLGTKGLGNRA